jgi:hypothetical protein
MDIFFSSFLSFNFFLYFFLNDIATYQNKRTMAQSSKNFPGITPPLSLAESSKQDKDATIVLESTLREYDMYETEERTQLRY